MSLHPHTGSYISIQATSGELGSLRQEGWSSSFSHMVIKKRKLSMAYFMPIFYQTTCQKVNGILISFYNCDTDTAARLVKIQLEIKMQNR